MTALEIEIREPNQSPRRIILAAGLGIGRHPDNSCVLNDPKVSGFHARVEAEDGKFFLVDLGSSNGTHVVDGKTLVAHERWPLTAGSRFLAGLTEFEVLAKPTPKSGPEPTRMMAIAEPTLILPPSTEDEIKVSGDLPPIPAESKKKPQGSESSSTTVKHQQPPTDAPPEPAKKRREARPLDVPSKGVPVSPNSDLSPVVDFEKETGSFPEFDFPDAAGEKPKPKRAKDATDHEDKTVGQPRVVFDQNRPAFSGPDPDEETIMSPPERRGGVGKPPTGSAPVHGFGADSKTVRTPIPRDLKRSVPDDDATWISDPQAAKLPKADEGLSFMRPRLVISTEGLRAATPISKREFLIGRKGGGVPQVDCALDHATVSSQHAAILFRQGRFFIEDRGSRNGTSVANKSLGAMGSQELRADEHIVFGMVDALFIVDRDHQLRELPRSPYGDALNHLVRKKRISRETADQLWQRCAVDGDHPAETLILSGQVSVKHWCEALDAVGSSGFESGSKRGLQLALVILALLLAGAIGFVLVKFR